MSKCLLILIAALLAGCGQPKETLNVISFPDYIDPKVIEGFEQAFGCKVVVDFFDSGDSGVAKLAGGASAYDVVGGLGDVRSTSKQGLLLPLNPERIPNLKNLDPRFTVLSFDDGVQYSVPYVWGTTGLYVRKAKDEAIDETWGLVFDPSKQRGPFYLINESRTCIGAALRYKGYSANSTEPRELAEARDLLIEAKKRSLGFLDGTAVKNRILTKGASVAMAWGDCAAGEKEDVETHYFMPREGAVMILDGFGILAKARHRELAEKFLNYLLEPKIGAQTANFLKAPTPNKAALELIDPADRNNPAIYPPPDLLKRLEMVKDVGGITKLYDELWAQIKSR